MGALPEVRAAPDAVRALARAPVGRPHGEIPAATVIRGTGAMAPVCLRSLVSGSDAGKR